MKNPYCEALGIEAPALERVKDHREAKPYSLMIAALLERGAPMTLDELARRFEEAGVAPADEALGSLRRCQPARLPVVRDGDRYDLDVHHEDLSLWAFRLGLSPPRGQRARILSRPAEAPGEEPPPACDLPVAMDELGELLRHHDRRNWDWSAQRYAVVVLDAHRRPMSQAEIAAFLAGRSGINLDQVLSAVPRHAGAPVRAREDGRWELRPEHAAVRAARSAVRERLLELRRWKAKQPDPELLRADREAEESRRREAAQALARERRAVVHSFPPKSPAAVVLLDARERRIETFLLPELDRARAALERYDALIGLDLRPRLRALGFDPGRRRLADLCTAQKSRALNRQGRTLMVTPELLIRGTCGISRPLGDRKTLASYVREDDAARLRRRLEADAKSLFAFHEYSSLHRRVRLRWDFLDELLPAPWVPWEEEDLYALMQRAHAEGRPLEVVLGTAPAWSEPWSRSRLCYVQHRPTRLSTELIDELGTLLNAYEVQAARLAPPPRPTDPNLTPRASQPPA